MNSQLIDILNRFNINRPYVWELHLSKSEFQIMEEYICAHKDLINRPTKDFALLSIAYLAEWYKRNYCGAEGGQTNSLQGADFKQIWEASGINIDKFVYETETGMHLWKYSIYVLGGLAIKHELNRNDRGKFLKALCKIFHGEEYTLENLDDESRAIAFRQSITKGHSLYEYLKYVLSNQSTGEEDELTLSLIHRIKTANDEVISSKFSLEWVVTNPLTSETMSRRLRIWLKPEDLGGKNHQYLKHERLIVWGITNPEEIKNLFFGIRWRKDNEIIQDCDTNKPLITYTNSQNGFVSFGIDRYATYRDIPVEECTHLDIIAFDADGNKWITQTEGISTWLQLWRIDLWKDEWSSKQSPQKQTSVIFTNEWTADNSIDQEKPFKNAAGIRSVIWNWCYIGSDITISGKGGSIQLFNRVGYYQIYTVLHKDTIKYYEGGKILHQVEDEEEGIIDEFVPVIFGREDIRIRHFQTKDAIINADVDEDRECDIIEFKEGAYYRPWTDSERPSYGIVTLRAYVQGVEHKLTVSYIGSVVRNITNNSIEYTDIDGQNIIYQDNISLNKTPLNPTVSIFIGSFKLDVYRPISIKEIYLDDKVHTYAHDSFNVPYILKDRVRVSDFGANGYHTYDCKRFKSIFSTFNGVDNECFEHFEKFTTWPATMLDESAPDWLIVSLAKTNGNYTGARLLKWNYTIDSPIEEVTYIPGGPKGKGDIYIQDMNTPDENMTLIVERPGRPDPFKEKRVLLPELKCFEIASKHYSYYSIFKPLRIMAQNDKTNTTLIPQLLAARNNKLTTDDKRHLLRLADEFCIDTQKLNIDFSNIN